MISTKDAYTEDFVFKKDSMETSVSISGRVRVSAAEGLRAAVLTGVGLAIASEFSFGPELKSGEVVAALEDRRLPPIILSAVYLTGRMASGKARAFVAFVGECLRK